MGDEKHRHETPPGYLGAAPEPVDPHDHSTSRPVTPVPPGFVEVTDARDLFAPPVGLHGHDGRPTCDLCMGPHSLVRVDRRCDKHSPPRWHEIATEGLPPDDVDVLVFGWANNVGAAFMVVARCGADHVFWTDDEYRSVYGVTHWTELPAPPTEKPR